MSILSANELSAITGSPINDNGRSVLAGLERGGTRAGLNRPHRLAQFLGQVLLESGAFVHDRELWGPTPAQERYDTRTDLGNTPERDGDGYKNRGRGPIQLTGGYNIAEFEAWARSWAPDAPDFSENPDLINTDPWEGLSAVWYWQDRGLNRYADRGDIEMVTKGVNGGLNGYRERLEWYTRAALVLLGRAPDDVRGFQQSAGLAVDGIAGPQTRAELHKALERLPARAVEVSGAKAAAPRERVSETTTAKASALNIAGAVTAGGAAVSQLHGTAQLVLIGAVAVIIVTGLIVFRERLKHFRAGVR